MHFLVAAVVAVRRSPFLFIFKRKTIRATNQLHLMDFSSKFEIPVHICTHRHTLTLMDRILSKLVIIKVYYIQFLFMASANKFIFTLLVRIFPQF